LGCINSSIESCLSSCRESIKLENARGTKSLC
jgi:hypothetical protein